MEYTGARRGVTGHTTSRVVRRGAVVTGQATGGPKRLTRERGLRLRLFMLLLGKFSGGIKVRIQAYIIKCTLAFHGRFKQASNTDTTVYFSRHRLVNSVNVDCVQLRVPTKLLSILSSQLYGFTLDIVVANL